MAALTPEISPLVKYQQPVTPRYRAMLVGRRFDYIINEARHGGGGTFSFITVQPGQKWSEVHVRFPRSPQSWAPPEIAFPCARIGCW